MHRGRHSKINSLHYFIKRTFMHIPSKAPLTPLSQLCANFNSDEHRHFHFVRRARWVSVCAAAQLWWAHHKYWSAIHSWCTPRDKTKNLLSTYMHMYIYIYKPARTQRKAPPGHVRIWCCINVLWSERLGWMENVADGIKSLCVCTYMSPAHGIITSTAPSEWEIYTEREEEESFSWKF